MKIAFWSPLHGTGASSSLLAFGVACSYLKAKKIIVTQTHFNLNNLERPLLGMSDSKELFRDTGLDAIMRHFKSGNITEEHIRDCSIKIHDYLYLMAGTGIPNREGFENNIARSMLVHILSVMENYFDIVLVDTNSGNNEYSMKIIDECDVVVVSMRQNRFFLEKFFDEGLFENKKVFYLFSDYDPDSKYSLFNIRHLYKNINKSNSAYLPHDTGYMDAVSDGRVRKYISSNLESDMGYPDDFFTQLKNFVDLFLKFSAIKKGGADDRFSDSDSAASCSGDTSSDH